jgi:phosphatidylserine/phosphatidylglycerophosphate/cardiolipin synthase-like enzyme
MFRKIISWVLLISLVVGFYGLVKPIPEGLNTASTIYSLNNDSIYFLSDKTYTDQDGTRHSEQQIFDEVFKMISEADSYILVDMFLFNDFLGTATSSYRQLSSELTNALIEKKKQNPNIVIQVITDPINTVYGGYESEHFKTLQNNNIPVIITDLTALRDSNPLYSGFWRAFLQWFPENKSEHLPNLFDINKPKTSLVSYLNSFNFKANHRKLIVTDYTDENKTGLAVLITSANPHDGSSAHSNTAIKVDDYLWQSAIESEKSVAKLSGYTLIEPNTELLNKITNQTGDIKVQLLTERSIKDKILESINTLQANDTLDMAMFYISDRDIVFALKKADERGVKIRLIFDPNKDAFGREKNGIPNRQVASELIKNTTGNTEIRWCDTHGEQCHSKLLIFKHGENYSLIQGSANLTRRNLENFNLETDVYVSDSASTTAVLEARNFFTNTWNNETNKTYTTNYESYAENNFGKKIIYYLTEFTGMSSY